MTNPKPPLSKSRRPKTDLINLSASPLNFTFKHFLDFPRHFTLNQGLALDLGERVSILWEPEIFLLKKWKRLYNSNYCNIIMKYANIIYQFCFSVWVRFRNWGIWPFFNFFTLKDFIKKKLKSLYPICRCASSRWWSLSCKFWCILFLQVTEVKSNLGVINLVSRVSHLIYKIDLLYMIDKYSLLWAVELCCNCESDNGVTIEIDCEKVTLGKWVHKDIKRSSFDLLKHCQRLNGLKALNTLTHSTPLVQSRCFNKLWNLVKLHPVF